MSRAHVLLVESIHASAQEVFVRNELAVSTAPGGLGEQALIEALSDLPGEGPVMVGVRSKTRVTAAVMDAVPRLSAIGAFCIGTDQIDLEEAAQRGISVFNAPFANTRSVAELVIAEIVMLSRQLFARSRAAHEGRWAKDARGAHEVRGKTLGIVGYGHIGSQLSILAEAMGLRVRYYDLVPKLPLGNAESCDSLTELLGVSDFVSLHVPDSELTRGMMGAAALRAMRQGAYLINASRGQVVDIAALREALEDHHLAGAAIDVFPQEPAKAGQAFESPLRGMDQVILTPHIGGSTQEAQANIGREVSFALSSFVNAGTTVGSVSLAELDAGRLERGCRLLNVHRNVPGVLSTVNRVIADSNLNIVSQHLATRGGVGLLLVDLSVDAGDPQVGELCERVAEMDTSIRTRVIARAR
jgi:D-3-phosphoglycerate dehydrogenase